MSFSVIIMLPFLSTHDAMSQDVIEQQKMLQQEGISCFLYAEFTDEASRKLVLSYDQLKEHLSTDELCTVIYHHGVFWKQGEDILTQFPRPTLFRYHSITPAHFYKSYDHPSYVACAEGHKQTLRLIRLPQIFRIIATSPYVAEELINLGVAAKKITQIPPFFNFNETNTIDIELKETLEKNFSVLFVGRVVPNKGIQHLIRTIDHYLLAFDSNIHLHIVGGLGLANPLFYQEIEKEIKETNIGAYISFHNKVSSEKLSTFYRFSQAFLVMSEHEGFCVPVIEAQHYGLPVVSSASCALADTAGREQIIIKNWDYMLYASALNMIKKNKQVCDYLRHHGYINRDKYKKENYTSSLLEEILRFAQDDRGAHPKRYGYRTELSSEAVLSS